ncbi:MAG: NAD(P)/FAD-dependent oxidoreductase [Gemmatimonadota bacterium]
MGGFLSDLLVVGAGPGGARAAELLAERGLRVALLDPRAPWEKPCGGGLTAAALRHTPELRELSSESVTIRELQVVASNGSSLIVPLRRPYEVVSRLELSRWGLDRALAAGVRFHPVAARAIRRAAGFWFVTDSAGRLHRARWLIGADGATSPIRSRLAPGLRPELAPTRVAYATGRPKDGRAAFFFLRRAEGYLWDFPRNGHRSVGIGVAPRSFSRRDLDEAIEHYRLAEVGEAPSLDVRGAVIATSDWRSGHFEDLGGLDYALVGDAAGLADPATGEGIDYALRSAALAADTFGEDDGFDAYPAAAQEAFAEEFRRSLTVRHWLYHPRLADGLVSRAYGSDRLSMLLAALVDAVNEHGPLREAIGRSLGPKPGWLHAPAVCDCDSGRASPIALSRREARREPRRALAGRS